MPWPPELFSAPVLAAFEQKREHELLVAALVGGALIVVLAAIDSGRAGARTHRPRTPRRL
jgi:hypothetical protein